MGHGRAVVSPHAPPLRYAVVTVGTLGDLHPFVRLAQALRSMGREVTLFTNPVHLPLLRDTGLDCVGFGTADDYLRVVRDPDLWHPRRGFAALMSSYKDQLLHCVDAMRASGGGPVAVIAHPLAVPGAAVARELGLASRIVSAHLAPSTLRTCHPPLQVGEVTLPRWFPSRWCRAYWRAIERGWIDPVALPQVNGARSVLGLPPVVSSFLAHLEQAPDLTLTLFPPWFGPEMPDWPTPRLSADFQLFDTQTPGGFLPELSRFLAAGAAPLVFTPGTGNLHAQKFFASALGAAASLGERAIMLTRDRSQLPADLPPSVLWQPYVPLSGLLPQAAGVVHHGGIGTTAEALRAGLPQVVTPFAWDQFDNASRVAELGVGTVLPARKLGVHPLARAIRTVVRDAGTRSRCQAVARRFDPPQDAARLCARMEAALVAAGA